MTHDAPYDLESVKLPRAGGGLLRALVALAESPLTRPALLPSLLESAGVTRLRALQLDEPPTFWPLWPHEEDHHGAPGDGPEAVPPAPPSPGAFRFRTVREYAEAYRSGAISPLEVAERALAAIADSDRLSPPMRIFIASYRDDVLAQAEASAGRFRAGRPLSVFDGVPVTVKDEVDMTPYPTTVGTKFLGREPAREDAATVARLRAAGALLLGKANMHEIGITPSGTNPHHGAARNPYDPGRDPGGSSSGPAAAAAAGLSPVALGADGGGSIRIPAAWCGLVGLKPTFGRVSEFGAAPLGWSVAHLGPLAGSAEDAALMLAVIAGPDPRDGHSLYQPPLALDGLDDGDLTGVRIGVYPAWFEHATPDIVAACRALLDGLVQRGARIVEIAIPELYPAYVAHGVTILAEMAANLDRYDREHRRDLSLVARLPLQMIRTISPTDYLQAQRVRTRTLAHFRRALEQVDVIATPATAITAPPIPERALPEGESHLSQVIESMRFVNPANFTGLPAISVPAGYDEAGLPIGLHLMGRAWEEKLLLRLAYAAGSLSALRRPRVWYDLLGDSAG